MIRALAAFSTGNDVSLAWTLPRQEGTLSISICHGGRKQLPDFPEAIRDFRQQDDLSDIPLDSHITLSLRSGLFGRTAYDTRQILRLLHQDIALLHPAQQVKRAEGRRHHFQQARASRASTSHQGHPFSPSYYAFLIATLGLTLTNHGSCPWAMTHQPSRCRPQREHQCEQQSRQREQCPRARKNSQRRDLLKCAAGRKPPIP